MSWVSNETVAFPFQCSSQITREQQQLAVILFWWMCEILTSYKRILKRPNWTKREHTKSTFLPPLSTQICQYFLFILLSSVNLSSRLSLLLLSLSLIISIIIFSICSERWRHKLSRSQREQLQSSIPTYYSMPLPPPQIFPLCEAHHRVHWTPLLSLAFTALGWCGICICGESGTANIVLLKQPMCRVNDTAIPRLFVCVIYSDLWRVSHIRKRNRVATLADNFPWVRKNEPVDVWRFKTTK